jgi:hypothetical protein
MQMGLPGEPHLHLHKARLHLFELDYCAIAVRIAESALGNHHEPKLKVSRFGPFRSLFILDLGS